MTYEIITAHHPPSEPYEALQDAVQAAQEYAQVWERGHTFQVREVASGRVLARFSAKRTRALKPRLPILYALLMAALLGGEAYLRLTVLPPQTPRQYLGSADMPFSEARTPDTLRILIIGDSYTWGQYVEPSERFADVLATYDERLEVVTLALKGSNTPMQFDAWKQYGRDVNADIVILAIVEDDNNLGVIRQPEPPRLFSHLIPGSELAAQIDKGIRWYRVQGNTPFSQQLYDDPATMARWGAILADFAEDIEASGAEPWALVLRQPFYDDEERTLTNSERTAQLATEAGFRTLNFIPVYQMYYGDLVDRPERWAAPGDSHYNAETHEQVAQFIWEMIQ